MLVYKALYRKMMDALKDAGMWLDWAEQLQEECPEVSKYLCEEAKERLEDDFPKAHEMFKSLCEREKDEKHCMSEMVEDHIMEWHNSMLSRISRMKD